MSTPFDFDAFIDGLDVDLPRFDVPLYRVNNESRIHELDEKIKAAAETPAGDDRISSKGGLTELTKERDRLKQEQDESAMMFELRALTAQEFADVSGPDKDFFDQIAQQSQGTRNEAPREFWEKVRGKSLPGSWTVLMARANEIIERTLVMPDFSLNDSATPSQPKPSAN